MVLLMKLVRTVVLVDTQELLVVAAAGVQQGAEVIVVLLHLHSAKVVLQEQL